MTQPVFEDEKLQHEVKVMTPWGEWGTVNDVAECVVFLASEDAAYVTGVRNLGIMSLTCNCELVTASLQLSSNSRTEMNTRECNPSGWNFPY